MFDQPGLVPPAGPAIRKPARWSLSNWPVRWKVVAIAVIPLLLAAVFGGVRVYSSTVEARDLAVAADRADLVPAVNDYMVALQNSLVTSASGGDTAATDTDYQSRSTELQERIDTVNPVSDVRLAATNLLALGQQLLADVQTGRSTLREQVTTFSPLLLTAETAITGSVRVADETVRVHAEGLARAVGARGQMAMQRMLVEAGASLPEPELRSSMVALAGTEPSTVRGMAELLGGSSDDAAALRSQMVKRLEILSDPAVPLAGNPELLQSIQTTDDIAQRLVDDTTTDIITTVRDQAADARNDAIRDAAVVLAAIVLVLLIVILVARSLTRPLRLLRDGALSIAHQDLVREIERVKAGDEREPDPLPIHTTEEIGQVAHAVDELHAQALLLAGDEARLRVTVNDMFETMSRRNKSLVDQQLSLIDSLERDEEDPDRLAHLFRLDHLATRMRRNGANLLVLAGAQVARGQSQAVPLASLIGAATSEVEEYQRVEVLTVPECSVTGAVAGDAVHLLAELIDNALRYSPPTAQVRVGAAHTGNGGVLVDVEDAGLGMTEGDLRISNMRLTAGGEVSPDSARHMGLFVVGRLARQHGMSVQLLDGDGGVGTKAQLYVPPELLEGVTAAPEPEPQPEPEPVHQQPEASSLFHDPVPEQAAATITPLPRRTPGSSGITGEPVEQVEQPSWWPEETAAPSDVPADTSGYFTSRRRAQWEAQENQEPEPDDPVTAPQEVPQTRSSDVDLIYQNMMSEWLVDPADLQQLATPQDWKSVWDNGWAAAADVDNVPVESHTDHGLPVRQPGARLVPGGTSSGTPEQTQERDPDAIRASLGSHFGGVHAGRTQASGNTNEGPEHE
ncbi:ATP-binding protein [Mycobacterium sp. MS1601]|nr:ATP-binding protein [Mycobacterium sp. MS1601]AQA06090.1 ATP-binding protein [Mycobacterium sp. MS1601]